MRVPMMRTFLLGALICATLCLSFGPLGCSSDSSSNVVNPEPDPGPNVEQPSTFQPGKDHAVDDPMIGGEEGDF